jgi:UDP-N-acetylglucosamine 3-dehydrogenase
MAVFRAAIIGCGDDPAKRSVKGYAMAYRHAPGYLELPKKCKLVACCDLVPDRAERFAKTFGVPTTYTDYHQMLAKEKPDIVSVCTWMHLHEQMVVDCAEAGVKAVHCEKPMATTWAGCKRMARVCEERGVQLTFNHMRRFGGPFRMAKKMLDAGQIGELKVMQYGESNLYDGGTHHMDMQGFFNDHQRAVWAMAQIDYSRENLVFGSHNENLAYGVWKYENGVIGQCLTGPRDAAIAVVGAYDKLIGTEGMIEVGPFVEETPRPLLRIKRKGRSKWQNIDTKGEGLHGRNDVPGAYHNRSIAEAINCLASGKEPENGAKNALKSTELIFACWESARRRGMVELPLTIEDNPLVEMVKSGALKPAKQEG